MDTDFLDSFTLSGSFILGQNTFSTRLAPGGDSVWVSVDYTEGQIFKINTNARVTIYDADGNVVASTSSVYRSNAHTDRNTFMEGLETGTYFVRLSYNFAGSGGEPFTIGAEEVFDDHGNGISDATALVADGTTMEGNLDFAGDVDTFTIDAVAGERLDFVIGEPGTDNGLTGRRIRLLDSEGNLIAVNSLYGETDDFSFLPEVSGPITVEIGYVSTGPGTPTLTGAYSFSVTSNSVTLIDGTAGADSLRGTAGMDDIVGLGGDDVINGLGGDDVLFGNSGHDTIRGGGGDDDIFGGVGSDTLHGGGGSDYMSGDGGHDTLYGGHGHDVLDGGAGRDTLYGGRGHDTLNGGDGADRLFGHEGSDVMSGGAGNDRLFGGAGDDDLHGGAGNDRLVGGEGSDWMWGGWGDDRLVGGGGDDLLLGGEGSDILRGGEGADVFGFSIDDEGHDRVRDFDVSEDVLLLSTFSSQPIDSFDDLLANAEQVGNHTVITLGTDATITLENVALADLHEDMFAVIGHYMEYFA